MIYLAVKLTTSYVNDPAPQLLPIQAIPLAFAVVAWRWHLVGSILLTGLAGLVLLVSAIDLIWEGGHNFSYLATVGMMLLVSGILHLAVSWREKGRAWREALPH